MNGARTIRRSGSSVPLALAAAATLAALGPAACQKKDGGASESSGVATPQAPARAADAAAATVQPAAPAGEVVLTTPGAADAPPAAPDAASASTSAALPAIPVTFLGEAGSRELVGKFYGPGNVPSEDVWAPSEDDVRRLLAGLPARLENGSDHRGREVAARLRAQAANEPTDSPWERYAVQIIGFVVGGKRLVFANFFCGQDRFADRAARDLVMVLDGGSCYFQVWFDPVTGEYSQLMINGEA